MVASDIKKKSGCVIIYQSNNISVNISVSCDLIMKDSDHSLYWFMYYNISHTVNTSVLLCDLIIKDSDHSLYWFMYYNLFHIGEVTDSIL